MNPAPAPHLLLSDPAFPRLKDYLIQATGLAYYADKDAELVGRIAPRLAKLGLSDCGSYLALLADNSSGPTELDTLIEELTIGETFFFRHQEMFDALRTVVLPDLIERNRSARQLRIWSAGCSIGAEAYSVAILLRKDLGHLLAGWDLTIIGTDINRRFLASAREGQFDDWNLRGLAEEIKGSCFVRKGKSWLISPKYKENVSFQYHNLATHVLPSHLNNLFAFDLILCRNVTIYFSPEIVRRIVDHSYQCLVEGGWLVVGHAEPNLELYRSFRTVNAPGAILYQKRTDQLAQPFGSGGFPASESFLWIPPHLGGEQGTEPSLPFAAPSGSGDFALESETATKSALPAPLSAPSLNPEMEAIRSLADRGEWEAAAQRCQEALTQAPLNPTAFFFYGLIHEQRGQHSEAEDALRRALYLDRHFVLAHYYLGLLLQKQGQRTQATRSFRNVLQLLAKTEPTQVFPEGDGITAQELLKLTTMHLKVLESV